MAIFFKYEGLDGEATAIGYEKWVEAQSLQFGVGRGVTIGSGGGSKREASAPSMSEFVITKTMDVFDQLMLKEAIGGESKKVEIHITQTDGKGKHIAFQKYKLERVLISSYSLSSGGARPMISASFSYAKIDSEYLNIDDKFQSKTTGHVTYDISKADV